MVLGHWIRHRPCGGRHREPDATVLRTECLRSVGDPDLALRWDRPVPQIVARLGLGTPTDGRQARPKAPVHVRHILRHRVQFRNADERDLGSINRRARTPPKYQR